MIIVCRKCKRIISKAEIIPHVIAAAATCTAGVLASLAIISQQFKTRGITEDFNQMSEDALLSSANILKIYYPDCFSYEGWTTIHSDAKEINATENTEK